MLRLAQPVEAFGAFSTCCQVLPPSRVRYTPRSSESLQSRPVTQAYTVSLARGSMRMSPMRSEPSSPRCCQVSPPSVVL